MNADYIYVADNNGSPCITDRKQRIDVDFMSEILKLFCIDTARSTNGSFGYFVEKYV